MAGPIDVAVRLASNTARVGWFYGVNRLLASRLPAARNAANDQSRGSRPQRPVPTRAQLFSDLRQLVMEDAADAAKRQNPGTEMRVGRLAGHVERLRAMARDLPTTIDRRERGIHDTAKAHVGDDDVPEYYAQDFHFQTGGHLTEASARIYDVQVETLFYGSADIMRRAAFRPIAAQMRGRDQRDVNLLDVACGTGRFLRDVRRAYPRMNLTGLDLSQAYLDEGRRHLSGLRDVSWCRGPAEGMPFDDQSQDIVTSIFLFHELPGEVRRAVAAEVARVLKPGGIFVLIDSLQFGDKPGWDGLLEAFPERFHEPYYRQYLIDDLEQIFAAAGLEVQETRIAFMSKVMCFSKAR